MEELDIATVTKRSISGIFALVSRTFFIGVFGFVINILLTIYLSPSVFGVYFLVTAVIAFLQYFSDVGLAAALIQKKDNLTQADLSTTFLIQQGLVIATVCIAFGLSPFLRGFYHFNPSEMYLLYALILSFFISSLKTIPSVILERNLRFEKLVIPELVETVVFGATAFVFAYLGYGVMSFSAAVLVRGVCGLITIYCICPWFPSLHFSKNIAKKLLSFGIPFQLNSFLSLVKDDLFLAYVGKVLPLSQVGYIGFAQKWAYMPLGLVMDNIVRISFPSFSRLTHDAKSLTTSIEKMLFATVGIIFPSLVGLVILAPSLVQIIPRYQKWEPALFSLSFFAINAALSCISTPLTNVLNAIGKVKVSLYLMIFWTVATWVLTPILIFIYGFNGVAIASAIISLSVILVVYIVKKHVQFNLGSIVYSPTVASIVMGIIVYILSRIIPKDIVSIFVMVAIGVIIYAGTLFVIGGKQLVDDLRNVIMHLRR